MEQHFEYFDQAEPQLHSGNKGRTWITPELTLLITAIMSANYCVIFFLHQNGVDLPTLVTPFVWGAAGFSFLALLFMTPFQVLATLSDVFTKRLRRAALSFLSASIGVGTLALMGYALTQIQ